MRRKVTGPLQYARLNKGTLAFAPLWQTGATMEVEVARPDAIALFAGGIDAWIGSDEGTAERMLDLDQVRRLVPAKFRKTPVANNTPTSPLPPRASSKVPLSGTKPSPAKALDPTAPPPGTDLFAKGSVWRGTTTGATPSAAAQNIEIVISERDGEKFKAEMRYLGRHLRDIVGTAAEGKIQWSGAPGQKKPGVLNVGTVTDTRIDAHFTLTGPGGRDQEGTVILRFAGVEKN
jgi:hypothetical protein